MRLSTIILTILLLAAGAYVALLRADLARLKQELSTVSNFDLSTAEPFEASAGPGVDRAVAAELVPVEFAGQTAEDAERSDWRERRRERSQRMASIFDHPEMRLDMVERQMSRIDSSYAAFFQRLELSGDEIETLKTLMAERHVSDWEARMRRSAAGSDEERERLDAAMDQRNALLEREIAALLGEDEADALQDYTESLPYRREVEALASSLSYTSAPLTAAQSEQLVETLRSVANQHQYTKDLMDLQRGGMSRLSREEVDQYFRERQDRDTAIIAAAAEALSDEQLAAFADRQIADRERDQRRMLYMLENAGGGRWVGRP